MYNPFVKYVLIYTLLVGIAGGIIYYNDTYNRQVSTEEEKVLVNKIVKTNMKLESVAFEENGLIPAKYTCDGENVSPPLSISDIPENSVSLALIVEDPDVPKNFRPDGIYDHWIVFNIPTSTKIISENEQVPGVYGSNTGGTSQYVGPCPPNGEHRYIFSLYAVDTTLPLKNGATKDEVLQAMSGHILVETKLIGRYSRK